MALMKMALNAFLSLCKADYMENAREGETREEHQKRMREKYTKMGFQVATKTKSKCKASEMLKTLGVTRLESGDWTETDRERTPEEKNIIKHLKNLVDAKIYINSKEVKKTFSKIASKIGYTFKLLNLNWNSITEKKAEKKTETETEKETEKKTETED